MFNHEDIETYSKENIPLNRDCFLISHNYQEEFSNALLSMLNSGPLNPSEVGYVSYAAVRHIHEESLEVSFYPDLSTRFHEVSISLPKDQIVQSVSCQAIDVKPHIFVQNSWLETLYSREYSVFALVDAIDVRKAIRNNELKSKLLVELRNQIDALASQNKDVSFISFADTLILKSNWSIANFRQDFPGSYSPESLLTLISKIQDLYKEIFGWDVYAVLTQGENEYHNESLLHISQSGNHICLNSLGTPFAELQAIEAAAKKAIKEGCHSKSGLYMDEQFYRSLSLNFDTSKIPKNLYKGKMKSGSVYYFYSSLEEIINGAQTTAG